MAVKRQTKLIDNKTWVRVFEHGQDWETLVPFVAGHDQTLDGELLARDPKHPHLLIAFDDFHAPCWIPADLVKLVLKQTDRFAHYIPVKNPDGRIFETNVPRFGPASFTIPAWIAANLDCLTAHALRENRAQRAADKEAEKRRNAARSLRLQSDVELKARLRARKKKREPDQGELL